MFLPVVMGIVPPIILLCYIYRLDKIEREPAGLIIGIFIFGVLSIFGAMILEMIGIGILGVFGDVDSSPLLMFLQMFLVVAPAEEFCKRFVVMRAAWNHPAFDYRFDAVVYCTASALGFAAGENFLYIMDMDFFGAVFRLIPVHTICGLFMGIYLGHARAAEAHGNVSLRKKYLWWSFLIPVLIHGTYDFGVSTGNDLLVIGTFIGIIVLTVIAFNTLKKSAREDVPVTAPGVAFTEVYHASYPSADPMPYQQPYQPGNPMPYQQPYQSGGQGPYGQPGSPAGQMMDPYGQPGDKTNNTGQ